MITGRRIWVGADPGGTENFGIAVIRSDDSVVTARVDCADEAVAFVKRNCPSKNHIGGVGVDAPLWFSSGRSSDRSADNWLRTKYKKRFSGGQVQTANSLRGAALVQGAMFVWRMREKFPGVPVTETHPKALLKALGLTGKRFGERFEVEIKTHQEHQHERDAVISAVAARQGFSGKWKKDLAADREPSEQDPSQFWLKPVHYFWPES